MSVVLPIFQLKTHIFFFKAADCKRKTNIKSPKLQPPPISAKKMHQNVLNDHQIKVRETSENMGMY